MASAENQNSYLWTKHFPKLLYAVLAFLFKKENQAQVGEIKERFKNEISNPVINNILMGLELKRFIIKQDMKDRRRKLVILTEDGQNLMRKLEELAELM